MNFNYYFYTLIVLIIIEKSWKDIIIIIIRILLFLNKMSKFYLSSFSYWKWKISRYIYFN